MSRFEYNFGKNVTLGPIEKWRILLKNSNSAEGSTNTREQPTKRGRLASSLGRRSQRLITSAGPPKRLSLSWDVFCGWYSPESPRRQRRRGYSGRIAARSLDLVGARVVWDTKKNEKLGLRRPLYFFEALRVVYSVLGAVGPRAEAASVALPLGGGGSRL